jgi:hypothetical protein
LRPLYFFPHTFSFREGCEFSVLKNERIAEFTGKDGKVTKNTTNRQREEKG